MSPWLYDQLLDTGSLQSLPHLTLGFPFLLPLNDALLAARSVLLALAIYFLCDDMTTIMVFVWIPLETPAADKGMTWPVQLQMVLGTLPPSVHCFPGSVNYMKLFIIRLKDEYGCAHEMFLPNHAFSLRYYSNLSLKSLRDLPSQTATGVKAPDSATEDKSCLITAIVYPKLPLLSF